jgi:hypothetical protein
LFIRFFYTFVFSNQIEEAVTKSVENKTGVRLENTISSITRRAVWSNLDTCIYYGIACKLFRRNEYNSLLLTSFGPSGKPLAVAAADCDVDVYILPHGVCAPSIALDESLYTGMFREGHIVAEQVDSNNKNFIPIGLPKLQMIYNKRDEVPNKSEQKTLLIGTTAGTYRDNFIYDIISPLLNQTDWKIIIKVHPSEEKSHYNKLLKDIGIICDQNSRLYIVDEDLYSWIGQSHLLLTTRSNVGIESVLLGTPAACYNPWSPDLWTPPYAKFGKVPCFRDASNFISFLNNMDYGDERERQETMLDDLYLVRGNSVDQIAAQMREEMK